MRMAVTGAFGYSGRYIARRLLDAGHSVLTLTNSLKRNNPFGGKVQAFPFHFSQPELLTQTLQGVDTLINTYWVRFNHRLFNHDAAVTEWVERHKDTLGRHYTSEIARRVDRFSEYQSN